jgi:hypothetical protein
MKYRFTTKDTGSLYEITRESIPGFFLRLNGQKGETQAWRGNMLYWKTYPGGDWAPPEMVSILDGVLSSSDVYDPQSNRPALWRRK